MNNKLIAKELVKLAQQFVADGPEDWGLDPAEIKGLSDDIVEEWLDTLKKEGLAVSPDVQPVLTKLLKSLFNEGKLRPTGGGA